MATRKTQKTDVPDIAPGTAAVQRYRARQEQAGAVTLYCTVNKRAAKAIQAIMVHEMCSKRRAVEIALETKGEDYKRKR